MNSMYMMMGWLVVFALLGIVFVAGVVLLIVGLVTGARAKKNQVAKRSPKVLIGIALALMILPVLVSAILVGSGLSAVAQDFSQPGEQYILPQEEMEKKVKEVLAAADAKDVEAMYALFSESARQNEPDLKEEIQTFLDAYPGRPDSVEYLIAMSERESTPVLQVDAASAVEINGKFIITKDGTNYYCQLTFGFVDGENPDEVGIKNIAIQSELAASRDENWYPYSYAWNQPSAVFVRIDNDADVETRCIEGMPVIFERYGRTITEKELYDFLEESTSLSEFMAEFGEPNADTGMCTYYYELASSGGSAQYAKIVFEEGSDQISDESSIISESGYVNRPLLEPRKMGDEEP